MLEDKDIEKLLEVLPTKTEMNQRFDSIEERLDKVEVTVAGLVTAVDGLISRVEMLNQEYLVLKERDSRHERWIKEIAEKVGVTLTV